MKSSAGFVQQNETALAELKQEVIALEEQRQELKACLQKDEVDARSKLDDELQKLSQQAEESISKKKIELEQQKALLDERKRSVDVSVTRLASQRSQFEERKKLLEDEVATEYQEKLNQKDRQLERLQRGQQHHRGRSQGQPSKANVALCYWPESGLVMGYHLLAFTCAWPVLLSVSGDRHIQPYDCGMGNP